MIICFLTLFYLSISLSYPFYFIWDMDHSIVTDILLIQSGELPESMSHPSFGMYLLLHFSQKIAYYLGHLSVLSMEDLSVSLNPLSAYAELTVLARLHSVFLALGIVLLLWISLRILFKPSLFVSLIILVFLGCQESLIYHSSMIRSEFYSVFFWAGSILVMVLSVKYHSKMWQNFLLIACGIFLGLCLFV